MQFSCTSFVLGYVRCHAWIFAATVLFVLELARPLGSVAFAQETLANPALKDDALLDMDRDQWRVRISEAKRRARQFVLERQGRSAFDPPTIADEERMASERVLNDDSLQPGDIVSTNRGLFIFRGRPDQERHESDFIAFPPR
jgi:hypothetical protein